MGTMRMDMLMRCNSAVILVSCTLSFWSFWSLMRTTSGVLEHHGLGDHQLPDHIDEVVEFQRVDAYRSGVFLGTPLFAKCLGHVARRRDTFEDEFFTDLVSPWSWSVRP